MKETSRRTVKQERWGEREREREMQQGANKEKDLWKERGRDNVVFADYLQRAIIAMKPIHTVIPEDAENKLYLVRS